MGSVALGPVESLSILTRFHYMMAPESKATIQ